MSPKHMLIIMKRFVMHKQVLRHHLGWPRLDATITVSHAPRRHCPDAQQKRCAASTTQKADLHINTPAVQLTQETSQPAARSTSTIVPHTASENLCDRLHKSEAEQGMHASGQHVPHCRALAGLDSLDAQQRSMLLECTNSRTAQKKADKGPFKHITEGSNTQAAVTQWQQYHSIWQTLPCNFT